MSKIHSDEYGLFIIQNMMVVRPYIDRPSKHIAGAHAPAKHIKQTPYHKVGDERWHEVGISPERANHQKAEFINPPPYTANGRPMVITAPIAKYFEGRKSLLATNPKALVALGVGKFYIFLMQDATHVSQVLGIECRITNGYPMAGIHRHKGDDCFQQLIASGYEVAVIDSDKPICIK